MNFIIQQGALLGTFNTCFQTLIHKFCQMLWRQSTFLMNLSKGGKHTKSKYSCLSHLTSQIHILFCCIWHPLSRYHIFSILPGSPLLRAVHLVLCEGLLFDWNAFIWWGWVEYHCHVSYWALVLSSLGLLSWKSLFLTRWLSWKNLMLLMRRFFFHFFSASVFRNND